MKDAQVKSGVNTDKRRCDSINTFPKGLMMCQIICLALYVRSILYTQSVPGGK